MSENGTVEKKATTEAERAKYIKAVILAAAGGAGIGAIIRSRKANKDRAKEGNPETSHNTIIVPIKKTKFLEELPTPRELAESRGEQLGHVPNGGASEHADVAVASEAGSTAMPGNEALTPEQISAKKKEIVGNGRKFNFFGKRAAAKSAQEGETKKKDTKPDEEKDNGGNGEKKEDDGRALFRDQDGKFVGQTDPIAVVQSEKDAFSIENFFDPVVHPIDTIGSNAGAIFDKPVLGTVGALGSIYLAAKISDAINERRRAKAKERLERAREEYVGILEGDEKKAEASIDMRTTPGAVLGTAFFVPMAAAALVTSKIIENRKVEKKKQKEMSDSYPDDPVILYKTSESKEIPITPEALIAVLTVKEAMIMTAERDDGVEKTAAWGEDLLRNLGGKAIDSIGNHAKKMMGSVQPYTADEAAKIIADRISDPSNNDLFLEMTRGMIGKHDIPQDSMQKLVGRLPLAEQARFLRTYTDKNYPEISKQVKNKLLSSQTLQNAYFDRFTNSAYDDSFGKLREDLVADKIAGWGFRKGGVLNNIISWIVNNLGIGKWMAGNEINDRFANNRAEQARAAQAAQAASQQQAQSEKAAPAGNAVPAAKPATPNAKAPAQVPAKPVQAAKPAVPSNKAVPQTSAAEILAPFGNLAPWMPNVVK